MGKNEYTDDDVIVIGGSDWDMSGHEGKSRTSRKWKKTLIAVSAAVLTGIAIWLAWTVICQMQFPKSRPDKEIIAMLSGRPAGIPGITHTSEEVMGVTLDIFSIDALHAHIADTVPDCSSPEVYLVTRCADYRIENDKRKMIGDFIQDGTTLSRGSWRAGFMAIKDGNAQIGVSRGGMVARYVRKHDGSFFRQLALVSAGTRCDRQYILKGKVTRCAYARGEDGKIHFVQTRGAETLYGFADALTEYGFTDAVYVTGGSQNELFYRDAEGRAHGTYTDDKPHKLVVWTR